MTKECQWVVGKQTNEAAGKWLNDFGRIEIGFSQGCYQRDKSDGDDDVDDSYSLVRIVAQIDINICFILKINLTWNCYHVNH